MTPQQAQQKTQEKMKAIETLCKQLEMVPSAEQVLTEGGILKNMVMYNDIEKYDIDKEKTPDTPPVETPETPGIPEEPKPEGDTSGTPAQGEDKPNEEKNETEQPK